MSYCIIIRGPVQYGDRLYYLSMDGKLSKSTDDMMLFPNYAAARQTHDRSYDKMNSGWSCEVITTEQAMLLFIMSE